MRAFFFFLLLIAWVDIWAECSSNWQVFGGSQVVSVPNVQGVCSQSGLVDLKAACSQGRENVNCPESYESGGYYYYNPFKGSGLIYYSSGQFACTSLSTVCASASTLQTLEVGCYYQSRCNNKCEADSLACISSGHTWVPGSGTQCGTCNDNTACNQYQTQCESSNGVFSGSVVTVNGSKCCRAICNVCNSESINNMYNVKKKICCDNNQAPPDPNLACKDAVLPSSGCGMVYSNYGNFSDGGWQCSDPSSSFEAGERFAQCFTSSSSGAGSSSSSDVSSSSDGENSSGSGDGDDGCEECPYLDSLLDTLRAQKAIVNDILQCITNPGLCSANDDNNEGDTVVIPDWVAEKMDSSLLFDTLKIHYIDSIKQVLESVLYTDSASLKADSIALHTLSTDLENIDNTIKSLSDTTRDLFRRLTNSNKINTESLTVHIDSLYKYQKLISESMDSAIYGAGGFNKIDGLTDSAIKYFRQIRYYDSIYHKNFSDTFAVLHSAIGDIGVNIGYNLGYGDTASKTLRNDLEGIKGAIDGIGNMLGGSSVDTSGGQSWGGYIDDGERLGDSIVDASGWNQLKNTNLDTVFENALNEFQSPDSVDKENNDSLASLAARLNDSLVAQNDTIKSHLPDSLSVWADSLKVYAPFADFDSLIYSAIGAKIPNRDDCPEDCQKWTINIPRMGLNSYTVDFGLCLGRAPLGNQSVFAFLKLMLRIIVSWICIFLIYKTFVGLI